VDGTTVTLPDTQANQATYPQQSGQKSGLGFPICRIVGVTCLSSGAVLNAAVGNFKGNGSGEQALLRTLLDIFEPGDVMLGDAFYGTYFLLAELQSRNVDALFEQHGARKRSTDFRRGKKLGHRDHLITLIKPKIRPQWMMAEQYESAPGTLTVRELEVGGRVLVTTLICPKTIPKSALKALYKRRWQVELDIRNIKTTLGMETLSCKTPGMGPYDFCVAIMREKPLECGQIFFQGLGVSRCWQVAGQRSIFRADIEVDIDRHTLLRRNVRQQVQQRMISGNGLVRMTVAHLR